MKMWFLSGVLSVLPALAHAIDSGGIDATVTPCDGLADVRYMAEPWDENTAVYSNGAVRVALLDTIEPATTPFRLLLLSPPHDEGGQRQCRIIGHGSGLGFSGVDFAGRTASYDPASGLMLVFAVRGPVQDMTDNAGWARLGITVNQQSGQIVLQTIQ